MSNPICTIIHWYGDPLRRPLNYEYCDGSMIDTGRFADLYGYLVAENPDLWVSATQARLPDLRGQFLRGFAKTGDINPNQRLGQPMPDAVGPHAHHYKVNGVLAPGNKMSSPYDGPDSSQVTSMNGPGIESETRPKNVAVTLLIKASKNGEERPLTEVIESLDGAYPEHIRTALIKLTENA